MSGHAVRMTSKQVVRFFVNMISTWSLCQSASALSKQPEDELRSTESEIRITLSQSAFEKLQHALELGTPESTRVDMYFDIPADGVFLLNRDLPAAKQRIRYKDGELNLQKSWVLGAVAYSDQGFRYLLSEKQSVKQELSAKSHIHKKMNHTFDLLEAVLEYGSMGADQKRYLEKLWKPMPWPKLKPFDDVIGRPPAPFVPAAVVKKERWKYTLETSSHEKFKIQLGKDSNALGPTQKIYYELECELKDTESLQVTDRLKAISDLLIENDILVNETSEISDHDFLSDLAAIYP